MNNSFCSIDEAWGNNSNSFQNNSFQNNLDNIYSLNTENNQNIQNNQNNQNNKLSKQECIQLLEKILSCKECEQLLFNHFKYQYNIEHNSNFLHNLSNNDIINIVLIGLCIIFLLDFFVKIGKLQKS